MIKNPNHLAGRLEALHDHMLQDAALLECYGLEEHGKELRGAAEITLTWVNRIKKGLIYLTPPKVKNE